MPTGVFAQKGDPLTLREQEVLIAYAYHGSTARAARALRIQKQTLKGYLTSIYRKLGVKSGLEAWSALRIG